ncbi:hypothetical protein PR202_gb16523 [Eleusine coracana subsp. coracana]|uniref:Uncharacterized protein n=1 Tax=Eleusine coracana subsp. coracana TaxID=191504 RepID=A0AAV5EYD0_ELECO|nr:hypothetical protein PR202_gb16523 [Eleusine coracana subsp. coracana]
MSYMRGDLLTKTRKLVKGLAGTHMAQGHGRVSALLSHLRSLRCLYIFVVRLLFLLVPRKLNVYGFIAPGKPYVDAVYLIQTSTLDFPTNAFQLQEHIDKMEYRTEKKGKKKAYKELKEIARSEGKEPPPNPYPSAIKEIQAEEKHYVHERKYNPKIIELAEKMKKERDLMLEDRKAWQ